VLTSPIMTVSRTSADSWWSLAGDLLSAHTLVWLASVGRDADLTPDGHRFFIDRYHRFANYHRRRGHLGKAFRYNARAEEHARALGGDGPPYAAAMAMPRPKRFIRVNAVSRSCPSGYDDAA